MEIFPVYTFAFLDMPVKLEFRVFGFGGIRV